MINILFYIYARQTKIFSNVCIFLLPKIVEEVQLCIDFLYFFLSLALHMIRLEQCLFLFFLLEFNAVHLIYGKLAGKQIVSHGFID